MPEVIGDISADRRRNLAERLERLETRKREGGEGINLHMACVCGEMVGSYLCEHPAVEQRPEWLALAQTARSSLLQLYQAIGKEHL